MRIFLTGGTGLLGSHVAQRLRERGDEVVALHRAGSDTHFLRSLGCVLVEGELGDEASLHGKRMEGCQGLVHSAAHIHGGSSLDAVRRVNVEGTRRVLEGAVLAGIAEVVHISSVATCGDPPSPIHEELPLDTPLRKIDFYGISKREGEILARSFHGKKGMGVTILRPPAIYGERDRLFAPKLATFLKRHLLFLLGTGRTRMAAVYAGNVAQAVEKALEGKGAGQAFYVTEDVRITQRDIYLGLAREMGVRIWLMPIPSFLAVFGAKVGMPWESGFPARATSPSTGR